MFRKITLVGKGNTEFGETERIQRFLGIRIQRTLFWLKANGEKKESLKCF